MTTRSHCLLFHKRSTDWDSPLGYKQVISHYTRRISLLLTLVLGFASDSCNNNDILLVVGYNYNITHYNRNVLPTTMNELYGFIHLALHSFKIIIANMITNFIILPHYMLYSLSCFWHISYVATLLLISYSYCSCFGITT